MKKITGKNILNWWFEDDDLIIESTAFDNQLEFRTDRFFAWIEAKYPGVYEDFMTSEDFNIEDEYYTGRVLDREAVKSVLTCNDMAEFLEDVHLFHEMLNGGFLNTIELIKNLKQAA